MAVVRVVPKEDYQILSKYLAGQDSEVVVLIPEEVAERTQLTHLDKQDIDYDCGGVLFYADLWVELVSHDDHYFVNEMKEREEE